MGNSNRLSAPTSDPGHTLVVARREQEAQRSERAGRETEAPESPEGTEGTVPPPLAVPDLDGLTGAQRWHLAFVWYLAATETEIAAVLVTPEWERTAWDWLRIAAIAFDQGDVDISRVAVRS